MLAAFLLGGPVIRQVADKLTWILLVDCPRALVCGAHRLEAGFGKNRLHCRNVDLIAAASQAAVLAFAERERHPTVIEPRTVIPLAGEWAGNAD